MTTELQPPTAGDYADINGLHLYYERHGFSRPMVVWHGGLYSSESWSPIVPQMADHHEVIAVDLQGHGRTWRRSGCSAAACGDGGWVGEGRPKGGHALAILPGLTHYNMSESPLVATTIVDFLDAS